VVSVGYWPFAKRTNHNVVIANVLEFLTAGADSVGCGRASCSLSSFIFMVYGGNTAVGFTDAAHLASLLWSWRCRSASSPIAGRANRA
jgi:hypothetical protein